jgi:hypothetical protein
VGNVGEGEAREEIGLLERLRDAALTRYDKRRDIEWKVTAGLWAAVVLMTGGAAGKVAAPWYVVAIPYFIIYCSYILWNAGCWRANWNDFQRADKCRAEIENHTTQRIVHENVGFWFSLARRYEGRWCGFLCDWSRLSQIIGTSALFALSTCVLVWGN